MYNSRSELNVVVFLSFFCLRLPQLADEYKVKFMETSAMNRTNVELAFTEIAQDIKKKMDAKVSFYAGCNQKLLLPFLVGVNSGVLVGVR